MKKRLTLHRETLRVLSGQDARRALGATNTDTCMDSITGPLETTCTYPGESQMATFCYPTRVNDCGYTHDAHCGASDFSFCVCAE